MSGSEHARPARGDDLLTSQDIQREYGLNPVVAESLMRRMGKLGKLVTIPGFRRDFVRRRDVEPKDQSGGTICE